MLTLHILLSSVSLQSCSTGYPVVSPLVLGSALGGSGKCCGHQGINNIANLLPVYLFLCSCEVGFVLYQMYESALTSIWLVCILATG